MTLTFAPFQTTELTPDHLTDPKPVTRETAAADLTAVEGPRRRTALPARVQASYTTRFVADSIAADPTRFTLTAGAGISPQPGDVVVAKVTRIGNHKRVETPESRKAILFDGSLILLAYGDRYAADQFLAHVPADLGPCHLVAAGGVAGFVTHTHAKIGSPTAIEPLGLLTDEAGVVNLLRYAEYHNEPVAAGVDKPAPRANRPEVIAVLGTSMNSGKSTTQACLVNGLAVTGRKVGAGKITGTGAGNDRMIYHDAGAHRVLDFTDFGYATTFKLDPAAVRALTVNLINHLSTDADVVIVEIADGVYQEETARLLRDPLFQGLVDHVIFAATDALGARAGVGALQDAGLTVSAATGVMTSSPLATAEAHGVLGTLGVPVFGTFALTDPATATGLLVRS